MMKMILAFGMAVLILSLSPAELLGDHAQGNRRDPDFVAQIATVAAIRSVIIHVRQYADEHDGRMPGSLQLLQDTYKLPDKFFVDGWKRRFYYYASNYGYIIASFGRSGKPDSQQSEPGGMAARGDFESDIVLINGAWAQSPRSVDRELL